MKKIFVVLAVLSLIAGTAWAADLNDGLTRQVWGQTKGRSVVSDGSVLFRIWGYKYAGANSQQISVSCDSVILYENGVATSYSFATYPTVGQMVDVINATGDWQAVVGPDARPGTLVGNMGSLMLPKSATVETAGSSKENPTFVYQDSSTDRQLAVGIEATEGHYNRIKMITHKYGMSVGGANIITVLVYDGDNIVWRKDINGNAYNTATDKNASPDTISFINFTDKGLAGSLGKSLVCVVSANTTTHNTYPSTASERLADHNVSILYDQF